MDTYIILSQAVAVLRVLRDRVDTRLTLLSDCDDMEKEHRNSIEKKLLSDKEDILHALSRLENLVVKLRADLK